MTLSLNSMNPKKCACCWPLVNGCIRNCGPVVIDTGGAAPLLDDTYDTCLTTPVASWATLAFADIAPGELADGVYASEIRFRFVSGWESCEWQVVAYCVADEAGNRGRKWVIELLFYNSIDGFSSITHEVFDWVCDCGGASFTFEGEGDIPECLTYVPPSDTLCTDGCPQCYTIVVSGFGGGSDWANANGTFLLKRDPCVGLNCSVFGMNAWIHNYGSYSWAIQVFRPLPDATGALWYLLWGANNSAVNACNTPSPVRWNATHSGVVDCKANQLFFRTTTPTPPLTSPATITATPYGC